MKLTGDGIRAALITIVTVATPTLPLLVAHRVLSADDATQLGAILAAVVGAFHGGRAVATTAGASLDAHVEQALAGVAEPDPTPPAPETEAVPAPANDTSTAPAALRIDTAPKQWP